MLRIAWNTQKNGFSKISFPFPQRCIFHAPTCLNKILTVLQCFKTQQEVIKMAQDRPPSTVHSTWQLLKMWQPLNTMKSGCNSCLNEKNGNVENASLLQPAIIQEIS